MPQIYETFWKVDGIAVFNPLAKANGNETILTQGLRLIFFSAKSEYF